MNDPRPRRERGELDSLEMLGHGIMGFTMTLLVLDLRLPEQYPAGQLWEALHDVARPAAAYGLGFIYLMGTWLSMRNVFRRHRSFDEVQTICWLLAFGLIALTPFTVSTAAQASDDPHDFAVAVRLMAIVVGSTYLLALLAALRAASRGQFAPGAALRVKMVALAIGPSVAAVALSYLSPLLALMALFLEVVLGLFATVVDDRVLAPPVEPPPAAE